MLREDIKDPRITPISITAISLSNDLSVARVRFVPLGGEGKGEEILAGLQAAQGFLRRAVGRALQIRHAPELRFSLDEGHDRAVRMIQVLSEQEQARAAAARGDGVEE